MHIKETLVYEMEEYPRYLASTDARYLVDKLCFSYNNRSGLFKRDMFMLEVYEQFLLRAFYKIKSLYSYYYSDTKFRVVCKGLDRKRQDYKIDITFHLIQDKIFFKRIK